MLAVLATLAPAVAASPAGAAGHATRSAQRSSANVGIVDIFTRLGFQHGRAAGTGIIVSHSGEVLTNNHVIRGATRFRVVDVTTHRRYGAKVVGYSISRDVAVLELARPSRVRPARLGPGVHVRVGQRVVARGNAEGRGGTPLPAPGQVIALHRKVVARDEGGDSELLRDAIVTDAAVVPGDSGGPLEDAWNHVIGIVTAGSTTSAHRGFAIPIKQALRLARQIENGRSSSIVHIGPTAFLGVVVGKASGGAVVQAVVRHSAAAHAGLVAGDVITSLAGRRIASPGNVRRVVLKLVPRKAVSIRWIARSGAPKTGTITPASGPPQ
jgi:S1-C subfamily serine protease